MKIKFLLLMSMISCAIQASDDGQRSIDSMVSIGLEAGQSTAPQSTELIEAWKEEVAKAGAGSDCSSVSAVSECYSEGVDDKISRYEQRCCELEKEFARDGIKDFAFISVDTLLNEEDAVVEWQTKSIMIEYLLLKSKESKFITPGQQKVWQQIVKNRDRIIDCQTKLEPLFNELQNTWQSYLQTVPHDQQESADINDIIPTLNPALADKILRRKAMKAKACHNVFLGTQALNKRLEAS